MIHVYIRWWDLITAPASLIAVNDQRAYVTGSDVTGAAVANWSEKESSDMRNTEPLPSFSLTEKKMTNDSNPAISNKKTIYKLFTLGQVL